VAGVEQLLNGLRAAAEPTRLRLLALCARSELTVTDLTQILGQSQPRVSRHLKLLCDAGLLDRFREGSWAFYRLAQQSHGRELARLLAELVPEDDPMVALDCERLAAIKQARAEAAKRYFRENAARWDRIRSLYVDDREVEAVLLDLVPETEVRDLLDIGTGTGRMLEIFAPRVERAVGIDLSREMLAVARANLERAGQRHVSVRRGDMYQLPVAGGSFDAVIVHQVLHYAERPGAAVAEAARVLRPGGRLVIVDFAPHALEFLRQEHAHRRLGFADEEVIGWCRAAGLEAAPVRHLRGHPLTVSIWSARRRHIEAQEQTAARAAAEPATPAAGQIFGV
jgi:ArsR family transcriptional regulator